MLMMSNYNIYITFNPVEGSRALGTDSKIEACLRDITAWMVLKKLMYNADKLVPDSN